MGFRVWGFLQFLQGNHPAKHVCWQRLYALGREITASTQHIIKYSQSLWQGKLQVCHKPSSTYMVALHASGMHDWPSLYKTPSSMKKLQPPQEATYTHTGYTVTHDFNTANASFEMAGWLPVWASRRLARKSQHGLQHHVLWEGHMPAESCLSKQCAAKLLYLSKCPLVVT